MHIHAKSPCRVDLAGGTLDIWPLYLFHENAVTVNFAVDRYTSCEIATRDDDKIVIRSADQNAEEIFDNLDALRAQRNTSCLCSPILSGFSGLEWALNSLPTRKLRQARGFRVRLLC